ncbi:DUF6882 domain-containing protein [Falsiroseomonas sp. HW251]|uniref:DUF6882 domain-containing protein n=1 Tax=Falsiroseomonas sp. HW251 TaxID=3390998 RepID=UPI003D322DCC
MEPRSGRPHGRSEPRLDRAFGLDDAPYRWDLAEARIRIGPGTGRVNVEADVCAVGSTAGETFLWTWANPSIPPGSRRGLEQVRAFGERHGLSLLTDAQWRGGRPEGLEMLAVAGRILDAEGTWTETGPCTTIFFVLFDMRVLPPDESNERR